MTGDLRFEPAGADVPVRVVRSARRRRTIALAVEAGVVVIRVPVRTPNAEIEGLLTKRSAWILGRLAREAAAPGPRALATGETVPYRGQELPLVLEDADVRKAAVELRGERIAVLVPRGVAAEERTATIRAALTAWYRARAEELLPDLARRWAARSGLEPRSVLVREQRRRWGSCGPDGTIRLNWRLVMPDDALAEYVVVHELAHLRHRHHQPAFWREVAGMLPDYADRRKRLRSLGPGLSL